jgi:CDP-glycerol glycerophosphotransferase (TagB/SpsB family)
MIDKNHVDGTPNLVVRIHPWDRDNDYSADVAGFKRVYVQTPFGHSDPESVFECVPSRADVHAYGALMTYADVLINIASTTSLDALATDTPIVNIAFDLTEQPRETSCARFYGYSHYKPIVDTGSVRLAHRPADLCELLNAYLADRSLDREARLAARKSFLTFSDSQSAERVAAAIASVMS